MNVDLRDYTGNTVLRIIDNKCYDTNGTWVYVKNGDYLCDADGYWKYRITDHKVYDTADNWVYEVVDVVVDASPSNTPREESHHQHPIPGEPHAQPVSYDGMEPWHNTIMPESMRIAKQLFSANPEAAIETAAKSQSNIWIVFAGLNAIIMALFVAVFMRNAIGIVLGLLASGLFLLALGGCVKLLFMIFKKDLPFTKVLDIVAVSMLVLCITLLLAAAISFLYFFGALIFVIAGWIAHIIMLYHGVLASAEFPDKPYWVYFALVAVYAFLTLAVVPSLLSLIIPDRFMLGLMNFMF